MVTNYHVIRTAQDALIAILGSTTTKSSTSSSTSSSNDNNMILPYTTMRPNGSSSVRGDGTHMSIFKAKVVGVDPGKDIAMLKVDAPPERRQCCC